MSIVLFILQILGIILLVALAIMIFLLCLLLFSPLSYVVEGDIHETKWVKAKAAWLLYLIGVRVTYEDNLIYGVVRVLWKKITFSYDLTASEEEDDIEEADESKNKDSQKEKKKDKRSLIDKIKDFVAKIKVAYPRIKKILTDERNKQAVIHLKDELIYLVKIFLPKKSKVHGTFSTGAPDTTGQLCGVIALFPMMYQKGWELRPDFMAEEAYFQGDFWGKGRLYLFQIVGIILRIVFDKNCRRMYTMIDRLMKSIKKTSSQEDK